MDARCLLRLLARRADRAAERTALFVMESHPGLDPFKLGGEEISAGRLIAFMGGPVVLLKASGSSQVALQGGDHPRLARPGRAKGRDSTTGPERKCRVPDV
jgi:hypothetical protein